MTPSAAAEAGHNHNTPPCGDTTQLTVPAGSLWVKPSCNSCCTPHDGPTWAHNSLSAPGWNISGTMPTTVQHNRMTEWLRQRSQPRSIIGVRSPSYNLSHPRETLNPLISSLRHFFPEVTACCIITQTTRLFLQGNHLPPNASQYASSSSHKRSCPGCQDGALSSLK